MGAQEDTDTAGELSEQMTQCQEHSHVCSGLVIQVSEGQP